MTYLGHRIKIADLHRQLAEAKETIRLTAEYCESCPLLAEAQAALDTERECRECAEGYLLTLAKMCKTHDWNLPIGGNGIAVRDHLMACVAQLASAQTEVDLLRKRSIDDGWALSLAKEDIEKLAAENERLKAAIGAEGGEKNA